MHLSIAYSFLLPNSIPQCGCPTSLFNHSLFKDTRVGSSLGLLQIRPFLTFMYMFLCEHMTSFLWNKCPGVQLLDYIFLPSWLQVWSCDLFCSICEKISDTHIFTSRNFKHLHSYSHLTSLCLNACNDLCRSCSVNLGSRGRHEKEPCLTCDSYEVLTIIKLIL